MKNLLATLFVILSFILFSLFVHHYNDTNEVLEISTPNRIGVDLNNDKTIDNDEFICLPDIETFSTEPEEHIIIKYAKLFDLSESDIISLGYLAEDFAQKNLLNEYVKVELNDKTTTSCSYGNIIINGTNYSDLLAQNGFGVVDDKLVNPQKFEENLKNARSLNLVSFNHHSNKYHTLDCPYGKAAHDKVLIPENQVPQNAIPCKVCHKVVIKAKKSKQNKKTNEVNNNIIQPPLNIVDGDIRVYYTDFTKNLVPNNKCNTVVCKEFIKLIDNSKESIDIASYGYDNIPAITTALTNAKNRGVDIRFVYDESFDTTKTYYKDNDIIAKLASKFMSDRSSIKTTSDMIMHNKFIIFDRKIVYTGSLNLSSTGLSGYDVNDVIIINSTDIANLYLAEFEQMLGGKFHNKKSKLNMNNRFMLGNSEISVYFSPKDKSSKYVIQLINHAKKYIYIPTFLITHKDITQALVEAHKRGIDVRLIIDANSTSTMNTKHKDLRMAGVMLKTENYAGKLHAKTMIIDDEYLITGSMNFSNSGENKNDENMLIIKNSKIAKAHKEFFLYLWTIIPNKYLKFNAKPEGRDSIGSCYDGIDNNFNGRIDKSEDACK